MFSAPDALNAPWVGVRQAACQMGCLSTQPNYELFYTIPRGRGESINNGMGYSYRGIKCLFSVIDLVPRKFQYFDLSSCLHPYTQSSKGRLDFHFLGKGKELSLCSWCQQPWDYSAFLCTAVCLLVSSKYIPVSIC